MRWEDPERRAPDTLVELTLDDHPDGALPPGRRVPLVALRAVEVALGPAAGGTVGTGGARRMSIPGTATEDAAAGAVFSALADPTRRRIVRALADGHTVTASSLAAGLPVTRQAVAKHLAALRTAGLAVSEPAGRETRYRLTPAPFTDAVRWMASAGARWDDRLARLDRRLEAGP